MIDWLTRNGRYLAAGMALLGLAVRLRHFLAAPSYWYDEAYLLVNVFEKSFAELTGPLRCDQSAPPLFLWALRALYLAAGRSELAMRLPAFVASALAVPLMVPLARRVAGAAWPWAVGFVAVSQTAAFLTVNVKPYAGDLFATVAVFLAGTWVLSRRGPGSLAVLVGVALLMPWLSYPAVFALAGVSLGLAIDAVRQRSAGRALTTLLFGAAWALSAAAVWYAVGRHQRSDELARYWQPFFLDRSSLPAAVTWLWKSAVRLGSYATSGLGRPLLILAAVGGVRLGRRDPALLGLPAGLFASAVAANALRLYPLEDRLLIFAAPALWLLAAAGIDGLLRALPGRRGWLLAVVLAGLLAPGVARYAYWLAVVPSKVEYREAFAYVDQQAGPDDVWWVSHPEVYEVYRGRPCLGHLPPAELRERCRGRRVWVIVTPPLTPPAALREPGHTLGERVELRTLVVERYDPE